MFSTPICVSIVLTTDSLVKGSAIKFDMDCNGKNCEIRLEVSLSGKILNARMPFVILSIIYQTKRKPNAKADRFTNIPKNKQKEKKPTNLMKKAKRYSKSENTILNSV